MKFINEFCFWSGIPLNQFFDRKFTKLINWVFDQQFYLIEFLIINFSTSGFDKNVPENWINFLISPVFNRSNIPLNHLFDQKLHWIPYFTKTKWTKFRWWNSSMNFVFDQKFLLFNFLMKNFTKLNFWSNISLNRSSLWSNLKISQNPTFNQTLPLNQFVWSNIANFFVQKCNLIGFLLGANCTYFIKLFDQKFLWITWITWIS